MTHAQDGVDSLIEAARSALDSAYAPYSGYLVGAALECTSGERFVGCNVESASAPAGICAERGALAGAVAAGQRSFTRIAICCSEERPATPCGVCRQALMEFGDIEVVSEGCMGDRRVWTLAELLPDAFVIDPARRARLSDGRSGSSA